MPHHWQLPTAGEFRGGSDCPRYSSHASGLVVVDRVSRVREDAPGAGYVGQGNGLVSKKLLHYTLSIGKAQASRTVSEVRQHVGFYG